MKSTGNSLRPSPNKSIYKHVRQYSKHSNCCRRPLKTTQVPSFIVQFPSSVQLDETVQPRENSISFNKSTKWINVFLSSKFLRANISMISAICLLNKHHCTKCIVLISLISSHLKFGHQWKMFGKYLHFYWSICIYTRDCWRCDHN